MGCKVSLYDFRVKVKFKKEIKGSSHLKQANFVLIKETSSWLIKGMVKMC